MLRGRSRGLVSLAVASLLVGFLPALLWPVRALAADCTVIWGQYATGVPDDFTRHDAIDAAVGRPSAVVHWYVSWVDASGGLGAFDPSGFQKVHARGATPYITWEPWDGGTVTPPLFPLDQIADGTYDEYLDSWAAGIRALGFTVLVDPMHEMQGNWYPWGYGVNDNTPSQYIAAFRHLHDRFVAGGASNALFVWHIEFEQPDSGRLSADQFYPGDGYVDWLGTSLYNGGPSGTGGLWQGFQAIFQPSYDVLSRTSPTKPIMISEFATVEAGGDKAAWIREAVDKIPTYPRLAAAFYFNLAPDPDGYALDSSSSALTAASGFGVTPYCQALS